ncbi:MAG: cytochrome c [Isosphaeraceae bacterium]
MSMKNIRVFCLSVVAVAVACGSLVIADEHGKLHEAMEKVGKLNNAINKAVRTPVAYKKDAKSVTDSAKELAKLAKETAGATDEAKKIKGVKGDAAAQWKTLAADFVKSTDDLLKAAEKEEHAATKNAHQAVKKSCSSCHEVFRVEED